MSTLFLQIQTGAEAVLTEEPTEKTMSILELMTSGGIGGILIMAFLGVLSIFAYIFSLSASVPSLGQQGRPELHEQH